MAFLSRCAALVATCLASSARAALRVKPAARAWRRGHSSDAAPIGDGAHSEELTACKQACEDDASCWSLRFCDGVCELRTEDVNATSLGHDAGNCSTYYLEAAAAPTPSPPPLIARRVAASEPQCRDLEAALEARGEQQYLGSLEAHASGVFRLRLCQNGSISGNLALAGQSSDIIGTHLRRCGGEAVGGDLCSGPPVAVFCGDNSPGMMDVGTPYPQLCGSLTSGGQDLVGAWVLHEGGPTAEDLVRDILASPGQFYFSAHSQLSRMWAYPNEDKGIVRGTLDLLLPEGEAMAPVAGTCFSMWSQLLVNEVQRYPNAREAGVFGWADFTICTNGTFKTQVSLFGNVSPLVAMHIHRCDHEGSEATEVATSERCGGAPVVNFCGVNAPGFLHSGAEYPEPCPAPAQSEYPKFEARGVLSSGARSLRVLEQEARHIHEHPELYYFNVHSLASYAHWFPQHQGMVRGNMQK